MALLVGLGIAFRLSNLSQPVYWVDEVATSMRVSGYTQAEVRAQVATGEPVSVADLQGFQTIREDRPLPDLMRVLSQSPEHAPLYFMLARVWAEIFGGSVVAMRSLPVLFSLLGLPAMYALGQALFSRSFSEIKSETFTLTASRTVGQSAMGLLAISPFFIAYSQEARPYSLWILLLLLMGQFLWRSLLTNRWQWWVGYAIAAILCLYTSLLTVLVILGQAVAVLIFHTKRWRRYVLTSGLAGVALLPWAWVVFNYWQKLQSNTAWMKTPASIGEILGTWFYSLAVLFFDVPVATNPAVFGLQVVMATATIGLIAYATWVTVRRAPRKVWSLVMAGALAIPVALLLIDIVRDGQAAATPRYLMPTHLGALIALAYLLSEWVRAKALRWRSRLAVAGLLLVSLVSCFITQPSPYLKSRNLSNEDIVAIFNAAEAPQIISTPHHIQDLISLSYELEPDATMYILPSETDSPKDVITGRVNKERPVFLFAPSEKMQQEIKSESLGELTQFYQPPPLISGGYPLTVWRLDLS